MRTMRKLASLILAGSLSGCYVYGGPYGYGDDYYSRPYYGYGGGYYYSQPRYGGSYYSQPRYGGGYYNHPGYGGNNYSQPDSGGGYHTLPYLPYYGDG